MSGRDEEIPSTADEARHMLKHMGTFLQGRYRMAEARKDQLAMQAMGRALEIVTDLYQRVEEP